MAFMSQCPLLKHCPLLEPSQKRLGLSVPSTAWEGRQGAGAAPVRSGTTVLLLPTKITFPCLLWTNNAENFLLKPQTSAPIGTLTEPLWLPQLPRLCTSGSA